jgi:hypothetical protein
MSKLGRMLAHALLWIVATEASYLARHERHTTKFQVVDTAPFRFVGLIRRKIKTYAVA